MGFLIRSDERKMLQDATGGFGACEPAKPFL
jgi:hypothetical protein